MDAPKKPKILVVDDEADLRALARIFLARCGYDVLEAGNGRQAVDAAASSIPDLILLDYLMPEMTGFQALAALRAQTEHALTPIVIVTANYGPDSHEEAIRLGADDCLPKPLNSTLVKTRVANILEKERLRKELETLRRNYNAMIVHDLTNPLMVVTGFAQLLLQDPTIKSSEFFESSLSRMLSATQRALALVAQTLDLSKMQAEGIRLDKRRVDLASLLHDIRADQQVLAAHKQIELLLETPGSLEAEVDPLKISEVIVNIVSNAIKFTPGGGRVTLRAAREPSGEIRIDVSDTGPGIPASELQMVFAPWKQASGRRANVKGYGLGLAISRLILGSHGGRIEVESAVGAGTTFHFWLPGVQSVTESGR